MTIHEQIRHNAQKCGILQHHSSGTTMVSALIPGMAVIEGYIVLKSEAYHCYCSGATALQSLPKIGPISPDHVRLHVTPRPLIACDSFLVWR